MRSPLRLRPPRWAVLLLAALALAFPGTPIWAQDCPPGVHEMIDQPVDGATNLSGTIRVDFHRNPPPQGWFWFSNPTVTVRDTTEFHNLVAFGYATRITDTQFTFRFDTAVLDPGVYEIFTFDDLENANNPSLTCFPGAPKVSFTVGPGPTTSRFAPAEKLRCRARDTVSTGSSTSPLTGQQSWTVPITSWNYKGATFPFGLTYASDSLKDPWALSTPELAGLSEKNSKWTHPYAAWVDLYHDETGAEYAVWHRGGSSLTFQKSGTTFTAPDSGYSLTYDSGPITSPSYFCHSFYQTTTVPYGRFIVTAPDGTQFQFATVAWQTGYCAALPHYLLARVEDRWGRALDVTWTHYTINGQDEPRVTRVQDGSGTGITLGYPDGNGLLRTVADSQGRTHSLEYSPVQDETPQTPQHPDPTYRQKLTKVTVYGPGSPRTVRVWQFAYRDDANPQQAYGGPCTGDLVIQKTAPDGLITKYRYEPIFLDPNDQSRPRGEDWDGRVTRISWADSEATGGERVITRTKDSPTQATMTYPGNVAVRYNYTADDPTSVTDLSTGRVWSSTFDSKHNLLTVRTPLEQAGNPLIQYDYVLDAAGLIDQITARVRQADGSLGDPVETQLNNLNLPTQVKAYARSGSGHPDEITQFQYDGDAAPFHGNLLKVIEAVGTGLQQETDLFYEGADGVWGLPTRIRNELGADRTFDYQDTTGLLLMATSPPNLVVGPTHPDRPASVTTLAYNTDGLPSRTTDPLGHYVDIAYSPTSAGSPNLVVTLGFQDGSSRAVTLDPSGRLLEARDELGIFTRWTYTPSGRVKTVRRAAGTANERLTTLYYNDQEDLSAIDPPAGSAGRISFDYRRYDQAGNLVNPASPLYEGQVTKIAYPDGSVEYAGYYKPDGTRDAGELEWRRKTDGSIVSIGRDEEHRITRVDYPASQGNAAFSVTAAYDEFGRVTSTSDATGTTSLAFDVLDRPVSVTPPSPQKALTYSYTRDTTLQRWITTVSAAGLGTYEERGDTKGRLSEVVNPLSQHFWLEYDQDGKNTLVLHANNAKEERTYTARDWLASVVIRKASGTVLDTLQYFYTDAGGAYDPTGHLRRELDAGGRTHAFFYSNLYELTAESHPDIGTVGYTYGLNGNRTSRTAGGATDYYGADANNKLLWVNQGANVAPTSGQASPYTLFQYDANGNVSRRERRYTPSGLLRTYTLFWDGDDRFRLVKEGTQSKLTALYDGGGLRVNKWDAWLGNHDYSFGPGGLLHDTNNNVIYTPGLALHTDRDRFVHGDWQGSTRYLSDGTGNGFPSAFRFDAFGQRTATGGAAPQPTHFLYAGRFGYQSEYSDSFDPGLGLQYVGQRYYDPAIGRFITPDPIGLAGGLNRYTYVGNNPVEAADPDGTVAPQLIGAGIGATVGAAWQGYEAYQSSHGDWNVTLAAAGRGAVIGGVAGATGSWLLEVGAVALGSGTAATLANAMISGSVADLVGQTFELGFGWRCQYDPWQTARAGVFSGVFATGAMGFQRVLATACFPADTPVAIQGGEKPIQEVRPGDLVLSADPVTGKQSYQRVTRTFVRQANVLLKIETEDGRSIEATSDHPFFVEGKGFIAAKRLARSDLLMDGHGRCHAVVAVTERRGNFTVYNFEVVNTHTYYAGGWWVHNQCGAYEVGAVNALRNRSAAGDLLDIHHAPQAHAAAQVIPGYDPATAPGIALPYGEHTAIPTLKGPYGGSARDLMALTLRDLRRYTNAPNSSLQELLQWVRQTYPGALNK